MFNPRLRTEPMPLASLDLVQKDPGYDDDFQTFDGRVFRLSYERLSIDGVSFATLAQLEQAWINLQASLGAKSRLASDPEWGMFPEPSADPLVLTRQWTPAPRKGDRITCFRPGRRVG